MGTRDSIIQTASIQIEDLKYQISKYLNISNIKCVQISNYPVSVIHISNLKNITSKCQTSNNTKQYRISTFQNVNIYHAKKHDHAKTHYQTKNTYTNKHEKLLLVYLHMYIALMQARSSAQRRGTNYHNEFGSLRAVSCRFHAQAAGHRTQ